MTIPFTHSENYVDLDRRFHVLYPGEEEPRSRKRLPIPDLRFEQTYLHRIRDCLHIQPSPATVPSEDGDYVSATNVVPLLTSSQQVIKIDWKSIAYVTLRDQVLMPMLQGILWGIVGSYYRPFVNLAKESIYGKQVPSRPTEGEGVSWLRSWAKRLGLRDITLGPLSVQGRT